MLDLSTSVIMPRDDFQELVTVAFNQTTTTGERVATSVQTFVFCTTVVTAFAGGMWAWYKSMAKLEDKKLANNIMEAEEISKINSPK